MGFPYQVLTAAELQSAEKELIGRGETVEGLMERAGRGAADWILRVSAGRPVTVLCGPGNNGGDGYVIARVLSELGVDVSVVAPMEPATEASRAAYRNWGGEPVDEARGQVFVDCLFGTGLSRPLSEELRGVVSQLVSTHELAVAIDLPSGVDSDTGGSFGVDIPSYDLTIALGAWKRAHWLMPASAAMGERRLVGLAFEGGYSRVALATEPTLHAPAPDAHKYSRGTVLVIGGEMAGAGLLAAKAAQHAGAGYVKLWSEHSHPDFPADLVHLDGLLSDALADDRIDALLIGPGLGRTSSSRQCLALAIERGLPTVLDADALHLLDPKLLDCGGSFLATPHDGELERLCQIFGVDAETKLDRTRRLHDATGMAVLAKGADNVLASDSAVTLFRPAPAWLSTAGTGDLLAGIAASRLATGCGLTRAASEAVAIHAQAARLSEPFFSASDLCNNIARSCDSFL